MLKMVTDGDFPFLLYCRDTQLVFAQINIYFFMCKKVIVLKPLKTIDKVHFTLGQKKFFQ